MVNWLPDMAHRHLHRPVPGRLERRPATPTTSSSAASSRPSTAWASRDWCGSPARPIAPEQGGPALRRRHLRAAAGADVSTTPCGSAGRPATTGTTTTSPTGSIRNGAIGSPRYTTTANSNWWTLPALGFVDTGLTPGATYSYQLVVNDPDGNTVFGGHGRSPCRPRRRRHTLRAVGARQRRPDLLADERDLGPDRQRPGGRHGARPSIGVTDGRGDTGRHLEPAGRDRRRHAPPR